MADKGWSCLGNGDAVKRCWACARRAVPADPEWVCSSQDLALCCGREHCQWHRVGDNNPSALQPQLTWRSPRDCGGNVQKHLDGLVSFVSFLSMTHLLRNCSPQKMCFVCQCSQQPLKILPSKILVDEGLLDLSGCDGFYLPSCCSFCCQLIQI